VVEPSRRPRGDRVACRALRGGIREAGRNMIGHIAADCGRAVPGADMAAVAIGGIQSVIVADVAGSAGRRSWGRVGANQSEAGHAVIEGRCVPTGGGVAIRAVGCSKRSACRCVHRIVGALPGAQVAAGVATIGRGNFQRVVAIRVAQAAGNGRMLVGEGKSRSAVIKFSVGPFGDGMAVRTSRRGIRESRSDVIRNIAADRCGAIPIRDMATVAISGLQREVAADVTRSAGCGSGRHVRAHQSKSCGAVIKLAVGPGGDGVAGCAGRRAARKSGGNVIGNVAAHGSGSVPVRQMAAHAVRGFQGVVVADVAGSAGRWSGRHMRADQSEAGQAVIE
jgi:hypothetical protein